MIGFSNWQAPLYRDEGRMTKHLDIPLYGKFEVLSPFAVNNLWQVEYTLNGKVLTGFIEDRFMEWYINTLPQNLVDIDGLQTPELNDAQQNIIWNGFKNVNMCGELCVAFIARKPLIEILQKWQTVDVPFYKRIFGSGKATGTGPDDLIRLFGLFGFVARQFPKTMKKYTPRLFAEMVEDYSVIVSTHLDTVTGALNGGGVLHWCVVLEVIPERNNMGWVRLYNPYNNGEEWYSWREFIATTRAPYGVIV